METVAAKVVGPRDGRAGFLGSILHAAQPMAHLLERRRSAGAASRDHLASRLRAILRRARRARRSRASRTADLTNLGGRYELEMNPDSVPGLIQRRFDLRFPGEPI
jgi:hypothetical protein